MPDPAPDDKPPTPEAVADRLNSAAIHVLRAIRAGDAASGLSPARLSALSVLVFGGPRTLGALAAAEQVRSPTMTGIVNGLAEQGLVERQAHASDGRSAIVHVTPAGRRLMHAARKRRIEALAVRLRGLERADLDLLLRAAELMEAVAAP